MHSYKLWGALAVCAVLAACGGGGGGGETASTPTQQNTTVQGSTTITQVIASAGANAATITVAAAPAPTNVVVANVPMVTVKICAPSNPSQCATINNVQVDTGSSGFRVLRSALDSAMGSTATWQAAFPQVTAPSSANALGECMTFADGIAFGGIHKASLTVANETASNLNIEVIDDPATPKPTTTQTNADGTIQTALNNCENLANQNTPQLLHANGVLGVGTAVDDCYYCHSGHNATPMYYSCTTSCTNLAGTALTSTQLVANPVTLFPVDNNGVIVELPAVPATGSASVTGVLVFGIGTQANNALGSAQVLQADSISGNITTAFQGNSLTNSFFDSGSNSLFFPASIATCADATSFYCPTSTQSLSAMVEGVNGTNATINFTVANTDTLTNSGNFAFNNQAGTTGAYFGGSGGTFDWGLPAFFGRNVYTAVTGSTTSGHPGPFYAF